LSDEAINKSALISLSGSIAKGYSGE